MTLDNPFELSISIVMYCRLPTQSGIFPVNQLLETSRITKLVLLHINRGIDPLKRLSCRYKNLGIR
ncbi:hypothetical protein Hanom_Chr08g00695181 [Helianthus anomalus]